MFLPKCIYYEKEIVNYQLGQELIKKYKLKNIPFIEIYNHNNIEELRKRQNKDFPVLKQNLIIGIRKTHKFIENHKVSDYLVPYTSSGCSAMCLYCYLVCNYNKCSYLRLFVNREEMLNKIIKISNKSEKNLIFEIGSNSDLILENTITNNLKWTIENFSKENKGFLTFPTKFDMVDSILPLNHRERIIIRVSINPNKIIKQIEIGTASLDRRIEAINKLADANYLVGILIAPVIFVEDWQQEYEELIKYLADNLNFKVKNKVFFEIIFMTYSYIHNMINKEAFPNSINIYNKELMTSGARGKYYYKKELKNEGEEFFRKILDKYFKSNEIKYIV